MRLYLQIFKNTLDTYSVYRLNFIMWRIRVVIGILITYFLWWTLFQGRDTLFGYDQMRILTYVLATSLIGGVVLSTRTHEVGDEINSGKLTNFLLKPLDYFGYLLARDTSDKLLNTAFSIVEVAVLVVLFAPPLFFQTDAVLLAITLLAIGLAAVLFFLISIVLGFIGFWTAEVWAPRFILFILVQFLSGAFFPLDVLPQPLFAALMITPFPYLVFFPAKIYLGQQPAPAIVQGFVVLAVWIGVLAVLRAAVWRRGLQIYTAQGR